MFLMFADGVLVDFDFLVSAGVSVIFVIVPFLAVISGMSVRGVLDDLDTLICVIPVLSVHGALYDCDVRNVYKIRNNHDDGQ
jgi:hypothetical protein